MPFRLTQHIIEAMGLLKIEGPFRKCCEVTLSLMQNEKNILMSYLRPFIYDPMMVRSRDKLLMSEGSDPNAVNVESVESKLKGIVKKYQGSSVIPLSCEGQVNFLLEESTSDRNLAVMWFHWNPYI